MNCQTKLRINHLTAVKSVAILESNANLNFYTWKKTLGTSVVRSNCIALVFPNSGIKNISTVPNINGDSLHIPYKQNDYFNSQPVTINGTSLHEEVADSTVLNGDCSVNTSDMSSRIESELIIPSVNDNSPSQMIPDMLDWREIWRSDRPRRGNNNAETVL
ncbi:HNF-1_N domain-containing protein [Trichonephila clavipes]|nr:HNF-1_N domain-containing protein [Trichonephila clavipes]